MIKLIFDIILNYLVSDTKSKVHKKYEVLEIYMFLIIKLLENRENLLMCA